MTTTEETTSTTVPVTTADAAVTVVETTATETEAVTPSVVSPVNIFAGLATTATSNNYSATANQEEGAEDDNEVIYTPLILDQIVHTILCRTVKLKLPLICTLNL